jgi:hypothetical protein
VQESSGEDRLGHPAQICQPQAERHVEDLNTEAARGLDKALLPSSQPATGSDGDRTSLITTKTGPDSFCALGHKACRDDRSVLYHRVPRLLSGWHGVKPVPIA